MVVIIKKTAFKFLDWLIVLVFTLVLISGGVLFYQWNDSRWNKTKQEQQKGQERSQREQLETRLKELELKVKQQQLAENYLTSTADLVDNSEIHNFFTDLLNTYSEKFATIKSINLSQLPLHFESFHFDPKTGKGYGEMGKCWVENIIYLVNQKEVNISLNRLYLLNRLGIDRYFTSDDYSYIDISFDKMIDTCCHELAHYLQYVKRGKSSCESDLVLGSGSEALESFPKRREKYDEELAREHEKWTQEIYQMIKQDISELEEKHRDIVYQILSQHPYKFYAKAPPLIKISRKIRLVIRDLRWDKVPFFVMWIFLGWLEKKYKYN